MLPLKPDPDAARNQAVRSLTRAAITTGLAALDRGIRPARFAQETWPQDNDVALVPRSSSGLLTRDDAPALLAISTAFLSALVPMSAGADLFNRSLNLSFGPGVGTISVPRLAIPNADFVSQGGGGDSRGAGQPGDCRDASSLQYQGHGDGNLGIAEQPLRRGPAQSHVD